VRTSKSVGSSLLIGLGLLTSPLALASHSATELVDNTEYVADALEPLVTQPEIQQQLVDQALQPLTEAFTSEAVVSLLLESAGISGDLPDPLQDSAEGLIQPLIDQLTDQVENTAGDIVASEAFASSWRTAVGDSHRSLREAVTQGGDIAITLPLQPFLELVRDDISQSGFPGVEGLAIPDVSLPLFTVEPPEVWQRSYQLASAADPWLALLAIGLTGVGVWFSHRRDIAWITIGAVTPLVTVVPVLVATWWIASQDASLATEAAGALLGRPLEVSALVSVVVMLVSATGWFVESRRRVTIA
jgi:hypothetical protein